MIRKMLAITSLVVCNIHTMEISEKTSDPQIFVQLQQHVQQRNELVEQIEQACFNLNNSKIDLETVFAKVPQIDLLNKNIMALSDTIKNLLAQHINPQSTQNLDEIQLMSHLNLQSPLDKQIFDLITTGDNKARPRLTAVETMCQEILEKASSAAAELNEQK